MLLEEKRDILKKHIKLINLFQLNIGQPVINIKNIINLLKIFFFFGDL